MYWNYLGEVVLWAAFFFMCVCFIYFFFIFLKMLIVVCNWVSVCMCVWERERFFNSQVHPSSCSFPVPGRAARHNNSISIAACWGEGDHWYTGPLLEDSRLFPFLWLYDFTKDIVFYSKMYNIYICIYFSVGYITHAAAATAATTILEAIYCCIEW